MIEEIKTVVAKDAGKGGMSAQGGYASGGAGGGQGSYGGSSGLAYAPAESAQMYQRKAVAKYEASPSEEYGSMALPTGMTLRRSEVRSKVFLKNGVPVYQSNYMGPALTRS